ncbi:hypothetical protein GUJ93_ZPchr0005g14405 [Zizania palustris]|uniref:Uncharacterized protein n=1 Tax=Zizania palustris TaxID=103762 RepID=A0A8J5VQJ8_ZIZPA|nr:hypothetical protein GUJ93_ZPchr0005g14405 [Zizania palustris]
MEDRVRVSLSSSSTRPPGKVSQLVNRWCMVAVAMPMPIDCCVASAMRTFKCRVLAPKATAIDSLESSQRMQKLVESSDLEWHHALEVKAELGNLGPDQSSDSHFKAAKVDLLHFFKFVKGLL